MSELPTLYRVNFWNRTYDEGLHLQEHLKARVANDSSIGFLLYSSPSAPVVTYGRREQGQNLLVSQADLARRGIALVRTDRGGHATLHAPGQLVLYPILNLRMLRLKVREYVASLEDCTINVLQSFGINGNRNPDVPVGVWVGHQKICSIGIHVERGVSRHGLAFNLSNDISLFSCINPCGITAANALVSLASLLPNPPSLPALADVFSKELSALWGGIVCDISLFPGKDMLKFH